MLLRFGPHRLTSPSAFALAYSAFTWGLSLPCCANAAGAAASATAHAKIEARFIGSSPPGWKPILRSAPGLIKIKCPLRSSRYCGPDRERRVMDSPIAEGAVEGHVSAGDDAWVPSSCSLCYASCSILAHRQDGVVVKIEGNPASVVGKGRLCGKGVSGIATHYDPARLNVPLKRTNPKKGIGVDPQWKEISWEEALDEVASHLKRVRAEDPRKLTVMRTTTLTSSFYPFHAFCTAFGTPNSAAAGGGLHCGNGAHLISGIMHASWSVVPDFEYCNYSIFFGASKGHSAGHASCSNMGKSADARGRGMKMIVVDPFCNFAAAKATEWVPLRVGTDAALALAMCNVMVNELGIYDGPYLQAKTNAPYLVGPDKLYVRHPETKQPLVWDTASNGAREFDAVPAAAMALEGEFEVNGVACS